MHHLGKKSPVPARKEVKNLNEKQKFLRGFSSRYQLIMMN
jgi:hypothetical protein